MEKKIYNKPIITIKELMVEDILSVSFLSEGEHDICGDDYDAIL